MQPQGGSASTHCLSLDSTGQSTAPPGTSQPHSQLCPGAREATTGSSPSLPGKPWAGHLGSTTTSSRFPSPFQPFLRAHVGLHRKAAAGRAEDRRRETENCIRSKVTPRFFPGWREGPGVNATVCKLPLCDLASLLARAARHTHMPRRGGSHSPENTAGLSFISRENMLRFNQTRCS